MAFEVINCRSAFLSQEADVIVLSMDIGGAVITVRANKCTLGLFSAGGRKNSSEISTSTPDDASELA